MGAEERQGKARAGSAAGVHQKAGLPVPNPLELLKRDIVIIHVCLHAFSFLEPVVHRVLAIEGPLDEHGVPETEEAISLGDGFLVAMEGPATAHEGRHEHDERRFGQVEVRDKSIDGEETVSRADENGGGLVARDEPAVFLHHGLEGADGSRADRDDATPFFFRAVQGVRGFLRDGEGLGMHVVVLRVLDLDGPECAKPDVEGDVHDLNALLPKLGEEFFREMETRGRCGGGARNFRIDGLIIRFVLALFLDVRGQRHEAKRVEDFEENALVKELHVADSLGQNLDAFSAKFTFPEIADESFPFLYT